MKAILLAAGVGKRLQPWTLTSPKVLVPIGGRTLLHRHLDVLSSLPEVDGLVIVVGYLDHMIREAVEAWRAEPEVPVDSELSASASGGDDPAPAAAAGVATVGGGEAAAAAAAATSGEAATATSGGGSEAVMASRKKRRDFPVEFVLNSEFTKGAMLSLYAAREHWLRATDAAIVMDADVLYGRELMAALVRSATRNSVLMDTSVVGRESGEEMIVCAKEQRAMLIDRSRFEHTRTGWDVRGENVGFLKLSSQDAPLLLEVLEEMIAAGHVNEEHEVAQTHLMKRCSVGYTLTGDMPWTEVDFQEDIDKAENVVLPKIRARAREQAAAVGAV